MWKVAFPLLAALFAVGFGGLVGGPQDIDVNDEGLQNALNFAVANHNRQSNDVYLRQVAEVVKAQRQVVTGLKYIITVKMGRTTCRKTNPSEECAVPHDPQQAQLYQCTFTVWARSWLSDIRVLKEEC
ncbi:cystatin C (amyloid angiopathy and cerebral hemorrhage) [Chaetodon auriga]|uniref:cystatin C (amyloid angiopathy and cerebral hemorrhage) n=1 Tax=Chaetodon auriga TaxID=39042 RepID=UPI004032E2D1